MARGERTMTPPATASRWCAGLLALACGPALALSEQTQPPLPVPMDALIPACVNTVTRNLRTARPCRPLGRAFGHGDLPAGGNTLARHQPRGGKSAHLRRERPPNRHHSQWFKRRRILRWPGVLRQPHAQCPVCAQESTFDPETDPAAPTRGCLIGMRSFEARAPDLIPVPR